MGVRGRVSEWGWGDKAVSWVHDLAGFSGVSLCVHMVLGLAVAVFFSGLRWTYGC